MTPALDIRELRALDAFKPTVIVTSPRGDPSESSKSVVLPFSVLPSLHDPEFVQKLKDSTRARLSTAPKPVSLLFGKPVNLIHGLRWDAYRESWVIEKNPDPDPEYYRTVQTSRYGGLPSARSLTLDAFYRLGSRPLGRQLYDRLTWAWEDDPETTLKLIYNFRSIHEGKNAKELFYHAFGWLWKNHPTTALASLETLIAQVCDDPRNVKDRERFEQESLKRERHDEEFIERSARSHGYWKDLLNIVSLAYHGYLGDPDTNFYVRKDVFGPKPKFASKHKDCDHPVFSDNTVSSKAEIGVLHKAEWIETAKIRNREAHAKRVKELATKLSKDKRFSTLYVTVARLFADALLHDITTLVKVSQLSNADGDGRALARERRKLDSSITLAAKWAPSAGGSFDRQLLMTSAIAEILFPYNGPPNSAARSAHAHTSRGLLRRYVLTPLRNYLAVPETYMQPGRWDLIQYNRIPAICFESNKSLFWAYDEERFVAHLDKVTKGKKTISGSLLPHELFLSAIHAESRSDALRGMQRPTPSTRDRVRRIAKQLKEGRTVKAKLELKMRESLGKRDGAISPPVWASMVSRVSGLGLLNNCIAICDVSESMGRYLNASKYFKNGAFRPTKPMEPIFPALALSILVAQLAPPPWKNMFITLAQTPELVEIPSMSEGVSLGDIAKSMSATSWGPYTDFEKVFMDLLLPTALRHKLPRDQMVKRVLVFSDMQFDAVGSDAQEFGGGWGIIQESIKEKYTRAGYDMPELVFWNLSSGRSDEDSDDGENGAPVDANQEGVSLMSGFSRSMLKVFIGEEGAEDQVDGVAEEGGDEDVKLPLAENTPAKKKHTQTKGESLEDKMRRILGAKSYASLKVYD